MSRFRPRAVALVATGVVAGGVLAGTLSANAAGSGGTTPSATPSTSSSATHAPAQAAGRAPNGQPPANGFGSAPVRSDEKAVSSTLAATLTQKAEAKTGGTVYRVETDSGDAAYEAHVKKSDGSLVTVKFDSSGTITAVEDGMGR